VNLDNKETLETFFDLTGRVLEIIDEDFKNLMPRGDLQGCVEAIIMKAMMYKEVPDD